MHPEPPPAMNASNATEICEKLEYLRPQYPKRNWI